MHYYSDCTHFFPLSELVLLNNNYTLILTYRGMLGVFAGRLRRWRDARLEGVSTSTVICLARAVAHNFAYSSSAPWSSSIVDPSLVSGDKSVPITFTCATHREYANLHHSVTKMRYALHSTVHIDLEREAFKWHTQTHTEHDQTERQQGARTNTRRHLIN